MGLFDAFKGHREDFDNKHHGSVTHDVLAGAVAYETLKAYEDHCAKNGKPDSHAKAKEIAAGLAAAAFTRLAETKGLDAWDAHKQAQAQVQVQEEIDVNIKETDYYETEN